jgi:U3 small nucleolar ribonucleoprotein component
MNFRIIRAKRTTQSNQDNNSNSGKLQLSGGLFSSNVTDVDKKGDEKKEVESKPLFNFTA